MANPLDRQAQVFGNKPSSLNAPVPETAQAPEDEFASFDIPAAEAGPSVESDEFAEFGIPSAESASQALSEFEQEFGGTGEAPSFEQLQEQQGTLGAVKQKADDFLTRLRLSFAGNENEVVNELQQKFGDDRARLIDGKPQFKYPGTNTFVDFDPDSVEFADFTADLGRFITEFAVEQGGEMATAPVLGGAAPLAGAATAPLAVTIGDGIAENILNIERDPERSRLGEAATASAFGLALGAGAAQLKRLRDARKLLKQQINSGDALEAAFEAEEYAKALDNKLAEQGLTIKVQGNKFILSPGQQLTETGAPEGRALDIGISDADKARKFFNEQGLLFQDTAEKLIDSMTNATGQKVDDLFGAVKGAARSNAKLEGELIGEFRDLALRQSKGRPKYMQKTVDGLQDSIDRFGGQLSEKIDPVTRQKKASLTFPDVKTMKRELFPDASTAQVARARDVMQRMTTDLNRNGGALPLNKVDQYYKEMTKIIDSNISSSNNRGLAIQMIDIKNKLRDDWTQHIGAELTGKKEVYQSALKNYSEILQAQDTLGSLLKNSDFSRSAFVERVFRGDLGKQRVTAIKNLISQNNPKLWDEMRSEYLTGILEKHRSAGEKAGKRVSNRINWRNVSADIEKADKNGVLDLAFESAADKNMYKDFLQVAKRIDNFEFQEKATGGAITKLVRRFAILVLPVSNVAKATEAEQLIAGIGKDRAFKKWLNGEGAKLVLKSAKTRKERDAIQNLITLSRRISRQRASEEFRSGKEE